MKKRETKFTKFARKLLIVTFSIFVIGFIALNSYESSLNIDSQKIEKEISTIESDIDGLNMKKQELATFSRITSIANEKGYTYKQGTATAAVVGVERE